MGKAGQRQEIGPSSLWTQVDWCVLCLRSRDLYHVDYSMPQNGSCKGTGEGLPRALPPAVMEQDLEGGEIEKWGHSYGRASGWWRAWGLWAKEVGTWQKMSRNETGAIWAQRKSSLVGGQTVSERSLQGRRQWGKGKQPRVELSQEVGCRRPAPQSPA